MSQNYESDFSAAVKKLKRRKQARVWKIVSVLFGLLIILAAVVYLLSQGQSLIGTALPIDPVLLLGILVGAFLAFSITLYIRRSKTTGFQSLWQIFHPGRLKHIRREYLLLGLTLLLILVISIPHFSYRPIPPKTTSPWAWKGSLALHPAIVEMPSQAEASIRSVAEYIAQKESDPYLRVKALHDYVINRVSYDLDVLRTGVRPPQDAQTVFTSHKAVCEGYANLFAALGRAIGLEVTYIRGRVRQDLAPLDLIPQPIRLVRSNYNWTLHAWNAVKVAGDWQLVDTTWDDTSDQSTGSYRAHYLMPPPKVMIVSHLPDLSAWQLLPQLQDEKAFEKQPLLTPQFFAEALTLISPTENLTTVKGSALIKIKMPPGYRTRIEAVFIKTPATETSLWDFSKFWNQAQSTTTKQNHDRQKCQSQQEHAGETQISCPLPGTGNYQVLVFSVGKTTRFLGQLKFQV